MADQSIPIANAPGTAADVGDVRGDELRLAARFAARDPAAVRSITTANNQRMFRAAWSILQNRSEAEDAVQNAYLRAFAAIAGFKGQSSLSTWLVRIAINEALGRQRSQRRRQASLDRDSVVVLDEYREKLMRGSMTGTTPEGDAARAQLRAVLETAIADLPDDFRTVFVLREIEDLAVSEVADILAIPAGTVKSRLTRARRRLQQELAPDIRAALAGTFPFAGADCDAMTARVLDILCDPH